MQVAGVSQGVIPGRSSVARESRKQAASRPRPPLPRPGSTSCARSVAMSMPQVHIVAYCTDLGYGPARGAEMLAIMLGFGIADPVKVTRSALQNAASIAGLFLTTEAVVADKPEKTPAPAGDPTGGMDF